MEIWMSGHLPPIILPDAEIERFEREYAAYLRSNHIRAEFAYVEGETHHFLRLDAIIRREQHEECLLQLLPSMR